MEYNLVFYESEKKSRDDKWCTSIYAENDEEAIKKVEDLKQKMKLLLN